MFLLVVFCWSGLVCGSQISAVNISKLPLQVWNMYKMNLYLYVRLVSSIHEPVFKF